MLCNKSSCHREKPWPCKLESSPCLLQLDKACVQTQTPSAAELINLKKFCSKILYNPHRWSRTLGSWFWLPPSQIHILSLPQGPGSTFRSRIFVTTCFSPRLFWRPLASESWSKPVEMQVSGLPLEFIEFQYLQGSPGIWRLH